jgi:coatomer subunit epsilon
VNLVKGGDSVQGAYYIYEELAQSASATSKSLNGQGVTEILLGRLPEAESTLNSAIEKDPQNADALVNAIVCATFSEKNPEEYFRYVFSKMIADNDRQLSGKQHPFVVDLEEKSRLFDSLSAKLREPVA